MCYISEELQKSSEKHAITIPFQTELRPALPVVFGAKDYREFRDTLTEMDRILTATGIEQRFITDRIEAMGVDLTSSRMQWHYQTFRLALRYRAVSLKARSG